MSELVKQLVDEIGQIARKIYIVNFTCYESNQGGFLYRKNKLNYRKIFLDIKSAEKYMKKMNECLYKNYLKDNSGRYLYVLNKRKHVDMEIEELIIDNKFNVYDDLKDLFEYI